MGPVGQQDGIGLFCRARSRKEARSKCLSRLQVSPDVISHEQSIQIAKIGPIGELCGLERRVLAQMFGEQLAVWS